MSRTAADIGTILFKHIKESVLFTDTAKPSGTLCKDQRPLNSLLEDVVINVVDLDEGHPVQRGKVEVYIYVNNLENRNVTPVDKSMPNTYRLQVLSGLAAQALKAQYLDYCHIGIEKHLPCEPDEKNAQHYAKFLVDYFGPNLN